MSVLDTLRAASQATEEETLCVDGALQAEWEQTRAALDEAAEKDAATASLADPGKHMREAAQAMESVRERMQAALVTFKFRPLPWTERLTLQADHPPRDGNIGDQYRGYNVETFIPALIRKACVSVTGADNEEQTTVPEDVWDALFVALNYEQVNALTKKALRANDQAPQVPPSARFLLESQDSEASSEQPSPGTSPRDGSEAGSLAGTLNSSESPTSSTHTGESADRVASSA